MKIIKLKDGTIYDCIYAQSGETMSNGERSMMVGVSPPPDKTPIDIETAFGNGNADRFEIGTNSENDGVTSFESEQVFSGFVQIKQYTVDRNYLYEGNIITAIQFILQEPDLKTKLSEQQAVIDELMLNIIPEMVGA